MILNGRIPIEELVDFQNPEVTHLDYFAIKESFMSYIYNICRKSVLNQLSYIYYYYSFSGFLQPRGCLFKRNKLLSLTSATAWCIWKGNQRL